jgi:uncharacterized protein
VTTILLGVVGSRAYGLSHAGSDIDRLGVFQRPTREILGRMNKGELDSDTRVTHGPDMCLHELGKIMRLLSENNPNALELLWLDEYETVTLPGGMLLNHRELFLSQRVRNRYVGYARGQIKKLHARGEFDPQKQTEKHGRHTARLLFQAQGILEEGVLHVRLTEEQIEQCFEWGRLADSDPLLFSGHMEQLITQLDNTPTLLREEPDMDAIRELLVEIRLMELNSGITPA